MVIVDMLKIKDNLQKIDKNNYLVLKSDAYGFGLEKIYALAYSLGFRKYAVLDYQDAIIIKKQHKDSRVLLMGVFDVKKLFIYERYNIEISINSIDEVDILKNRYIKTQIAVNSGMNRFGIRLNDIADVYQKLIANKLKVTAIYTHVGFNYPKVFKAFASLTNKYHLETHLGSSADLPLTNGRTGVAIYQNSITLLGKIIRVNKVYQNEFVGYGDKYQVSNDGYIGVIDIGYSNGLERDAQGFMVYVNGNFYPLIGYCCMNHAFVLLPHADFLHQQVEFIGVNNPLENYQKYFKLLPHQIFLQLLKNNKKHSKKS